MPTEAVLRQSKGPARKLELGGALAGVLVAWAVAATAIGPLLAKVESTASVLEDDIPDPQRTRVFAVAASIALERIGLGLLLGAALVALGVLAQRVLSRDERPRSLPKTLALGVLPVVMTGLGGLDLLTLAAVSVTALAVSLCPVDRRASAISAAGAALAVGAGAWVKQAGSALHPFVSVGAAKAPALAEVLSHWPSFLLSASASALLLLALAAKAIRGAPEINHAPTPERLAAIAVRVGLGLALWLPGTSLAAWTTSALDARATCGAGASRLGSAVVVSGPAAIGECVPHETISVSKSAVQLGELQLSQGNGCEADLERALRARIGPNFVLPTSDTSMRDLECALRGVQRNAARPRTTSAFVARAEPQGAVWPLGAWNALPLRAEFTLVEQLPDTATPVLRVESEVWHWGPLGRLEPLSLGADERLTEAKRRLAAEPVVGLQFAPEISTRLVIELIRSARAPLLLLDASGKGSVPPSPATSGAPGRGLPSPLDELSEFGLLEGPARALGGAPSGNADSASVYLKRTGLLGELDEAALDAALEPLRGRLGPCLLDNLLDKELKELRYRLRFVVQAQGYVLDVRPYGEQPPGVEQRCVRQVFERMSAPKPISGSAVVEVELTFTAQP